MDPVIVRDGPRGRLIPAMQNDNAATPKGLVAAEIIVYVMDVDVPPTTLTIAGLPAGQTSKPLAYTVQLLEDTGSPRPSSAAVTVNLASDSATGKFDTDPAGTFTKTSVTVPAGATSAVFYYRDTAEGTKTLTALAAGLTSGTKEVRLFAQSLATPGEVYIFTGVTGWIDKAVADQQAQICVNKLNVMGVANTWTSAAGAAAEAEIADWVVNSTGNGQLDVLVLYGYFPPTIYAYGNAEVDGSLAELFIESEDGDAIMNHADYMFYVTSDVGGAIVANGDLALMQMMDIPGMAMWYDNAPMVVTADGAEYTPSLVNFLSDRPFNLGYLAAQAVDWYPELILAQDAAGTWAEPIIVRDGPRGRLIPVFQASFQDDPKGAVAAEIIAYLHGIDLGEPTKLGILGRALGMQGRPLPLTVQVQDLFGSPADAPAAITVNLSSTSGTGRFDTAADGSFNGSVTSVSIPAGGRSATILLQGHERGHAHRDRVDGGAHAGDPGADDLRADLRDSGRGGDLDRSRQRGLVPEGGRRRPGADLRRPARGRRHHHHHLRGPDGCCRPQELGHGLHEQRPAGRPDPLRGRSGRAHPERCPRGLQQLHGGEVHRVHGRGRHHQPRGLDVLRQRPPSVRRASRG